MLSSKQSSHTHHLVFMLFPLISPFILPHTQIEGIIYSHHFIFLCIQMIPLSNKNKILRLLPFSSYIIKTFLFSLCIYFIHILAIYKSSLPPISHSLKNRKSFKNYFSFIFNLSRIIYPILNIVQIK